MTVECPYVVENDKRNVTIKSENHKCAFVTLPSSPVQNCPRSGTGMPFARIPVFGAGHPSGRYFDLSAVLILCHYMKFVL